MLQGLVFCCLIMPCTFSLSTLDLSGPKCTRRDWPHLFFFFDFDALGT